VLEFRNIIKYIFFSAFVLGLVIYNNKFTQYKTPFLDSIPVYVFIFFVITIQLLEFFIWKNINNKFYNSFFTRLLLFNLFIQPIVSLFLIQDDTVRTPLLIVYIISALLYSGYKLINKQFESKISKLGHLNWNLDIEPPVFMGWVFFFLVSFFIEKNGSISYLGHYPY